MELRINDRIRDRRVKFFNRYQVTLRFDAMASSFGFDAYFNPRKKEHMELFCIGHYHIVYLEHNGELILTGNIINEGFRDSNHDELAAFSGYSLAGIMEDCKVPPTHWPLQFDGLTLKEIAQKLCGIYNIPMIIGNGVAAAMDEPYEKTTMEPSQSPKDYLTELATQKNIVISHNNKGHVLFTRARTNQEPILEFNSERANSIPFDSMHFEFDGQGMHSHIYVVKQAGKDGGNAGEAEIRNPYVPFLFRPTTIIQSSGDDVDTEKVARMALASELKGLKLKIVTDRWEVAGKVIKPNSIITVVNHKIYIFKKTRFFVEEVQLNGDEEKTTATLTCCLPEVYNGQVPEYIYKGINIH